MENMIEPKEIQRSNRRSLSLIINEKGELIIHAPKKMPLHEILDFVSKKEDWISKKQNSIKGILQNNQKIVEYEEIFFLGKRYKIVETIGIDKPYLTADSLLIKPCKSLNMRKNQLKNWCLSNTETILVPRIQKLANFMKLNYNIINIINSKAKWGMCDSKKQLFFNWKLIMLSHEVIDYVIIHELSHLIELNHSTKFWEIVKAVIPNYKHAKEIVKRCGFLIKLF